MKKNLVINKMKLTQKQKKKKNSKFKRKLKGIL